MQERGCNSGRWYSAWTFWRWRCPPIWQRPGKPHSFLACNYPSSPQLAPPRYYKSLGPRTYECRFTLRHTTTLQAIAAHQQHNWHCAMAPLYLGNFLIPWKSSWWSAKNAKQTWDTRAAIWSMHWIQCLYLRYLAGDGSLILGNRGKFEHCKIGLHFSRAATYFLLASARALLKRKRFW